MSRRSDSDSDSSSDSVSSSSSYSSSSGEGHLPRKGHAHMHTIKGQAPSMTPVQGNSGALGSAAGAPLAAARSSGEGQMRLRPVPVAQRPNTDAMTQNELGKPVKVRGLHSVTYPFNMSASPTELARMDKGKQLTLRVGKGLGAPTYSHAADGQEARFKGAVNEFVVRAELKLEHTAGMPLQVTVPINLMHDEKKNLAVPAPGSTFGILRANVDKGVNTLLAREVIKGQLQFLKDYPGQTGGSLEKFVVDFKDEPEQMGLHMKVRPATEFFYNKLAAAKGLGALTPTTIGKSLIGFGPTDLIKQAHKDAVESINAHIAYSRVSDPSTMSLTFSVQPRDTLKNGEVVTMAVGMHETHTMSSARLARLATDPANHAAIDALSAIELKGALTVYYLPVAEGFTYEAEPADAQ